MLALAITNRGRTAVSNLNPKYPIGHPVKLLDLLKKDPVVLRQEKLDAEIFKAINTRNIERFEHGLRSGAHIEARDKWGFTSAIIAARKHWPDLMSSVIRAGANLDAVDRNNSTPLHHCVLFMEKEHSLNVARMLVKAGASLTIRDHWGGTPYERVPKTGYFDEWLEVLKAGDA